MTKPEPAVLWKGKPVRHPVLYRRDLLPLLFNLAIAAALGFVATRSAPNGRILNSVTVAALLCAVLLGYLVYRLTLRQLRLRSVEYTVTDQDVMSKAKAFGRTRTYTVPLGEIEPPVLAEETDGTGTITFGQSSLFTDMVGPGQLELAHIPDARRVRDLIAEARHGR